MPYHTSRRGADLVQTWSEQFVPTFSIAVQDVLRKGFQQVNIRPPLPPMASLPPPQTTGPSPFSPVEGPGFIGPIATQPYAPPGYVNPPGYPFPPTNPGAGPLDTNGNPTNGDDGTGPGDWNPPVPNDPGDGNDGWGPRGGGGHHEDGPTHGCLPSEYWDIYTLSCLPLPFLPPPGFPADPTPEIDPTSTPPVPQPGDDPGVPCTDCCGNGTLCDGYFLDIALYPGLMSGAAICPATLTDGTCVCPFTEMFSDPASTVICPHCAVSDCGTLFMGVVCCYEGCGSVTNPLGNAFDNYSPAFIDCADWCTLVGDGLPNCNQAH